MKLSIVTVVRNGAHTIRDCLESVQRQEIAAEHIVVDGESSDGTRDILDTCASERCVVISQPDQGIYDAMCKGVARATGDIVGTLNADDFFAGPRVLSSVVSVFADPALDSCYGDLVYVKAPPVAKTGQGSGLCQVNGEFYLPQERVVRRWQAGQMTPDRFYRGWMPPHPTFFVRRSVYDRFGLFRLDLGTSADYELMLRFLVKHRITTRYIPEVLVKMRVGGVSNASLRNRLEANRNDRRAWVVNDLEPYPWTLWLKPLRKVGQWL